MGLSSLCRFCRDCIIATRGYNFREGQDESGDAMVRCETLADCFGRCSSGSRARHLKPRSWPCVSRSSSSGAPRRSSSCVSRKLRFGRIDGGARRRAHETQYVRSAEPDAVSGHPCSRNDRNTLRCSTISCCLSAAFSASSRLLDLTIAASGLRARKISAIIPASGSDSITSSMRTRFSVHTGLAWRRDDPMVKGPACGTAIRRQRGSPRRS
jgi:hypothetical protein